MKIYRTFLRMKQTPEMIQLLKSNSEYEHNDLWSDKDDAFSYVKHVSQNDRCIRAEMWELHTDEGFTMFKEDTCLFEYDVNGNYIWEVEAG